MTPITAAQARAIVDGSLAYSREHGFNPMAVIVVDAGGHTLAFAREDGTPYGRYDIAFGKAQGALAFGASSRRLELIGNDRPSFLAGLLNTLGPLVPGAGAAIVLDGEGNRIGAVGLSGDTGDHDEAAALAGIAAAGLIAAPV